MPLTAYYFMGQDLCIVRRHVREDMEWMADAGTDSVAIGIHEFQIDHGKQQQLDIIFDEAQRVGMSVHAIPSRWAGIVAGWPRAAGKFAATHPDSWMIKADGTPFFADFCGGAMCSIHDPATYDFFRSTVERMMERWPLKGIVWDEIKTLRGRDHSKHALQALGRPSQPDDQLQASVDFFSRLNRFIRSKYEDIQLSCFIYAFLPDNIMKACAGIAELDYFGIDGKCYPDNAPNAKTLFGNFGRAAAACAANDVKALALIETQSLNAEALRKTVENIPSFLENPVEHLLYYYYGASRDDDQLWMSAMQPFLRDWRDRHG